MNNTRDDFWEVVWQTKPLTIVLLCDFNEMGIVSTMSLYCILFIAYSKYNNIYFIIFSFPYLFMYILYIRMYMYKFIIHFMHDLSGDMLQLLA